jgi:hypothetical protein
MSPRPSGRIERIRRLNDTFRLVPLPIIGRLMLAEGVMALDDRDRQIVLAKVAAFDTFGSDNDPYGEHDFGAIDHGGERFFWKIDYYDLSYEMGSPDPADPAVTRRVLTVMRADEY